MRWLYTVGRYGNGVSEEIANGQESRAQFRVPDRVHPRYVGWQMENSHSQLSEAGAIAVCRPSAADPRLERQDADRAPSRPDRPRSGDEEKAVGRSNSRGLHAHGYGQIIGHSAW